MWAAEQKHPGAVKALLDGGADFRLRSGPAGLPRNYMAPQVRTNNVDADARRYAAAAASGRTYAQQLAAEGFVGRFGGANAAQPAGAGGGAAPPASPEANAQGGRGQGAGRAKPPADQGDSSARPAQAPDPDDDDNADVVVAGLVGSGGGALDAVVFWGRGGWEEQTTELQ